MGVEFDKRSQIFAMALTADAIFPFAEPNELTLAAAAEAAEQEDETDDGDASEPEKVTVIDWAAATNRLYQVPVEAGNYSSLQAAEEKLFMLDSNGSDNALKSLPISNEDPELTVFSSRVSSYELSADGEKLFLRIPGSPPTLAIVPVAEKAPEDLADFRIRTQGWRLPIDPAVEWQQMFLDGWRLHRDFAFDSNMRGVDWEGVRDRLLPLVPRIGHRSDLSDLLGQMAAEIGILHSQVRNGDMPNDDENGSLASLGARYAPSGGGLEIVQIYQGERDRPETRAP